MRYILVEVFIIGTKERREKEKESMKNAILEAAIKIIKDEGYDNLTMRKLADAIDYTPTAIYSYYKDKAEIVFDISLQLRKKTLSYIKADLEKNKENTVDEQLKSAFKVFIKCCAEYSEIASILMRSGTKAIFGLNEEPVPPEENGVLIMNHYLTLGQQELIFRKLDDNISWMLITALIGFAINSIENNLHLSKDWDNLVEIYAEMLINGIMNNS